LGGCLQRQHDARLAEQPADAVAGAGALLHKPWRARCTMSRACWSTVLMGTRRIGGRCTALQMAAASAPSFLPRLPLMRHGATNFGATSRTVWPSAWNCRAQLIEKPHFLSWHSVAGRRNAASSGRGGTFHP
jgi:hypothetical protein